MTKKRQANDTTEASGTSTKKIKTATTAKFTKEAVEAAGFCSHPELALTAEQVDAVLTDNETILKEKELVGKGTKCLHQLNDGRLVFYYTGKKCVKKDRERFQAMVEAVDNDENCVGPAVVLLATDSGICKRNTLPQLCEAGYVDQRVGGE